MITQQNKMVTLAAFVVVVAGMKAASPLIVPFLLAVFLAIICSPFFFWMRRKGIPSALGILSILIVVVGVWLLLAILVTSSLGEFSQSVPAYQKKLAIIMDQLWNWLSQNGFVTIDSSIREIINPGRIIKFAAGTLNSLGGMLTNAFFILLMFVTILFEAHEIPKKIIAIRGKSSQSLANYNRIIEGVNRYLALKTCTSLATGVIIYIFLSIQQIDFAILWGLLTFMLNYIPNIGSIIAAIPVVLLSLIQFGLKGAVITAIGYLLVNLVIGSVIEPKVMGRGVGLSTLIVLLSMIFWGWVLGPVGTLLSVPLTMTLKVALWNSESGRWVALLLGSNRDVSDYLKHNNLEG